MSALFAEILVKPPFSWGFDLLGYVFMGQIATAVAVPVLCGYFSDQTTRLLSTRNNGISEVRVKSLTIHVAVLTASSQSIAFSHLSFPLSQF